MRQLEDIMGEVVEGLAAGRKAVRRGDRWRLDGRELPPDAVEALLKSGLVKAEGGALLLMPAGRRSHAEAHTGRLRVERRIPEERPVGAGSRVPARSVTVQVGEAPLGWLRARGLISARQFDAGEQLHADWTRAQLAPSVTMRWDAAPAAPAGDPGARLTPSEAQVAARARFHAAIAAAGAGLGDMLWRVVCAGEGLAAAERALGWPGRSGKVVLGIALDRLADHYRLPGGEAPKAFVNPDW